MGKHFFDQLFDVIYSKKSSSSKKSYTSELLNDKELMVSKVIEESKELINAAKMIDEYGDNYQLSNGRNTREELVHEIADLLFHSFVLVASHDISLNDIVEEFMKRSHKSGLEEKKSRSKLVEE